jgi:hypothetical protein
MWLCLKTNFEPITHADQKYYQNLLNTFTDRGMTVTEATIHFTMIVDCFRAANGILTDAQAAQYMIGDGNTGFSNPGIQEYLEPLMRDVPIVTWRQQIVHMENKASHRAEIANWGLSALSEARRSHPGVPLAGPWPGRGELLHSEENVHAADSNSDGVCFRCYKHGHKFYQCDSTHCARCHNRLTKNYHDCPLKDPMRPEPQLYSLGMSPGAPGSHMFPHSAPTQPRFSPRPENQHDRITHAGTVYREGRPQYGGGRGNMQYGGDRGNFQYGGVRGNQFVPNSPGRGGPYGQGRGSAGRMAHSGASSLAHRQYHPYGDSARAPHNAHARSAHTSAPSTDLRQFDPPHPVIAADAYQAQTSDAYQANWGTEDDYYPDPSTDAHFGYAAQVDPYEPSGSNHVYDEEESDFDHYAPFARSGYRGA